MKQSVIIVLFLFFCINTVSADELNHSKDLQCDVTISPGVPAIIGSEEICKNIKEYLDKEKFKNLKNIKVTVRKALWITYMKEPIIENVEALVFTNQGEPLSVEFTQEMKYIDFRFWKSVKSPKQIGRILGKKIAHKTIRTVSQ